jgi:nucleotide-binding universal stress UspA family protein
MEAAARVRLRDRTAPPAPSSGHAVGSSRPVLLTTFDVPVLPAAAAMAVDAAFEAGRPLIVANVIGGSFYPSLASPTPTAVVHPDVEESLRAPAELAASLGVQTERLRVLSPRPIEALVELVEERRPGLLVIGADPTRLRRRFRERLSRRVHDRTSCLVWPASPPS